MGRRKAREETLKILYPLEVGRKDVNEVVGEAGEMYGNQPQWPFVKQLVHNVYSHLSEIDAQITPYAKEWPIHRMAAVDRTLLRIAVAEMLYFPDIPYEVTINEAIELAKKYGDVDSGSFVNGILANIHRELLTGDAVPERDTSVGLPEGNGSVGVPERDN